MTIDATFWVAISFFIFVGLLIYFKIPKKIQDSLDENILNIKNQIDNAEKLKEEAKSLLSEHEKKLSGSKSEVAKMLSEASEQAERNSSEFKFVPKRLGSSRRLFSLKSK